MTKPHIDHTTTGILLQKENGDILDAHGDTVPADGTAGYATGCLFRHTDGGDGTALYVNEGTRTSADFNALNGA